MAEPIPSLERSTQEGSDQLPDTFCEPCYAASDKVKPVAGYCKNCDEKLCKECFTSHIGHTLFRSHTLVKTSATPIIQPTTKNVFNHKVREYMPTVALIIVAIILTSILNYKHAQDQFQSLEEKLDRVGDDFVDLMTKAEKQAELAKREDFTMIEEIVMEQINKLTEKLETLMENENEGLFIAMQHAKSQLQSLEEKIDKLDKDYTVKKLKAILKIKRPTHVKDITVTASSDQPFHMFGSLVLPNKQILITDWQNKKLKLIDANLDKIISEKQLSGNPYDITKVKENVVAVTVNNPNTIKFISLAKSSISYVREVTVDGFCRGINYNDRDHTLIVSFDDQPKVKILDMKGNVIKCIEHDSMGDKLFIFPRHAALSPDMTKIYVTDWDNDSVTLLSLNGYVKAVYKDKTERLSHPVGVYVHTSGLVYVVGQWSHTVHQLDTESGEFRVLLEQKDGLGNPRSISYCEIEDKMYIGMYNSNVLKVFQMK